MARQGKARQDKSPRDQLARKATVPLVPNPQTNLECLNKARICEPVVKIQLTRVCLREQQRFPFLAADQLHLEYRRHVRDKHWSDAETRPNTVGLESAARSGGAGRP